MRNPFIAMLLVLGCATSSGTTDTSSGTTAVGPAAASNVPEALKVLPDQKLFLEAHAVGVQIYQCEAKPDDPSKFAWSLKAPEAGLNDASDNPIGKHYAGPTWESIDGSKVVGELKALDPGPDGGAIPWLLLDAKSVSGEGIFAKTTAVQRLDTVGGKAPSDGCSEERVGNQTRVDYRARYVFYRSP